MKEPDLHVTPTHASEEFEGTLAGVTLARFGWVAGALVMGVVTFLGLIRTQSLPVATLVAAVPTMVVILALRFLQQGRPTGHPVDLVDSVLTGGHACPPRQHRRNTAPFFGPFPDAYQAEGLTVFNGPADGHAAMGWEVQVPDLQTASVNELNRHQDAWSALLRQLAPSDHLQITLFSAASDGARLLDYRNITEGTSIPSVRRLRNLNFVSFSDRLAAGDLRQRRVVLFLGRPLTGAAPWRASAARRAYELRLAEVRAAFAQWEQVMHRSLEPVGIRIVPLADRNVVRLWAERLNPSVCEATGFDPARHFDPEVSLLDQCWHSELRALGRQGFVLDGYLHLALSLKRLPTPAYPSLPHPLTHLPFPGVTLVAQVRRLPREPVLRRAQASVERIHRQTLRKPDERLAVTHAQLEDKIRRLTQGDVVPLEFGLTVLLRAKTPEELSAMAAATKAAAQGMNGAQMYEATLPASSRNLFAGALPGSQAHRRSGFVHYGEDRYVADLLPVASSFLGHPGRVEALFPGSDSNLVNVVSFLGEGPAATPQNTILLGTTGVGKSLVLNKLLHETDPHFEFTAIVDFGLAQLSYARSHGREPIILNLEGPRVLNPFDTRGLPLAPFQTASLATVVNHLIGLPADEERARRQAAFIERATQQLLAEKAQEEWRRWPERRRDGLLRRSLALHHWMQEHACPLLDAFLQFQAFAQSEPTAAAALLAGFSRDNLRDHEIRRLRQIQDLVFAELRPDEQLRLSSLREHLEMSDDEFCRGLAVQLVPWTEGGVYGRLFDGVGSLPVDEPVRYFELGQLPKAAKVVTDVAGLQVINEIHHECLTKPRHHRKRVVIEELSRFLAVQGAETLLRELAESFRKHNVQLITTAQTYSRIADSPIRAALVGSTRAWLIFNTGDRRDVERLGTDLGLSRAAQEAILRFPRPDQQVGSRYSEFLYYHTDARQPICGAVRYHLLDDASPDNSPVQPIHSPP